MVLSRLVSPLACERFTAVTAASSFLWPDYVGDREGSAAAVLPGDHDRLGRADPAQSAVETTRPLKHHSNTDEVRDRDDKVRRAGRSNNTALPPASARVEIDRDRTLESPNSGI